MQKIFITLSFLAVVLLAVPFSVGAQQTPEPQAKLTEAEKQAMLAQIVQQLEEVQYELLRLSLVVAKLELEEQALALQTQLEERRAEEAKGIAMVELPLPQKEEAAGVAELIKSDDSLESERPESPEDIFRAVSLERESTSTATTSPGVGGGKGEEDEKDEEDRGFLAALGPLGNLGTPELAALTILAVLAVFILVRRLRGGARKTETSPQPKMVQPQVFQSSSERTQTTPDEPRQELKEGIAWK